MHGMQIKAAWDKQSDFRHFVLIDRIYQCFQSVSKVVNIGFYLVLASESF